MHHSVVIERILLKNFAPLVTSTGQETIEINRKDSPNKMILILGENGSGKSFLLNEITPLPLEHVEFRSSSRIVPDKEGRKELDILVDNMYRYRCVIIYSATKKISCFISKENITSGDEPKELNANGNVTSYLDILEVELGLTKSYTNIGYISKSVTSLVEMKPAERNAYISVWLPSVTEYLAAYKSCLKKYNLTKREIEMINADIGKIIVDDYKNQIDRLKHSIDDRSAHLEYIQGIVVQGETLLKMVRPVDRNTIQGSIRSLKTNKTLLDSQASSVDNTVSICEQYSTNGKLNITKALGDLEKEKLVLETTITQLDNRLLSLRSEIDSTSHHRSSSTQTLTEVIDLVEQMSTEIQRLKTEYHALTDNDRYGSDYHLVSSATYTKLLDMIVEIKRLFQRFSSLSELQSARDNFASSLTNIQSHEETILREKRAVDEEISNLAKRMYALQNNGLDPKILELKPPSCNASTCGLVRELLTYTKPEAELNRLQKEMSKLEDRKLALENEISSSIHEKRGNIKESLLILDDINHTLYRNKDLFQEFPDSFLAIGKLETFAFLERIEMINALLSKGETISSLYERLTEFEKQVASLTGVRESLELQEALNAKVQAKVHEYEKLNTERVSHIMKLESIQNTILTLKEASVHVATLRDSISNLNTTVAYHRALAEKSKALASSWYYRQHAQDIIFAKRREIQDTQQELTTMKKTLEDLSVKIISRDSLEERRNEKMKTLAKYDIMLKTWSPRVGFPALVISDFLEEVKAVTNEDLKSIWGGTLQIEDFVINNNEFSIVINRSGTSIPDASECSEGERSTLAMAISIAIIEINTKHMVYNVLRFDEADSMFDESRRRKFLDIVTERLEKMNCDSAFIITHNNEFDFVACDVILLPGAKFSLNSMSNKNIIFAAQ